MGESGTGEQAKEGSVMEDPLEPEEIIVLVALIVLAAIFFGWALLANREI